LKRIKPVLNVAQEYF